MRNSSSFIILMLTILHRQPSMASIILQSLVTKASRISFKHFEELIYKCTRCGTQGKHIVQAGKQSTTCC
eukprot:m.164218 g.164218  ORF g.164218 m.164218 type:complete len:70 (+) comp16403_c5_seq5:145-354(+)